MSIKNVLAGTTFEYEVDRALEESEDPWSRDQNVVDEVGFIRECDAVRAISLSAHSEDVDERGMIKVTKWDGEDQDSICFAKRKLEWGAYFMDHDIKGRIVRIAKRRAKSAASRLAQKAAVDAYLSACEDADNHLVQLARGLCNNLI
jgi:hypothetical protein